MKNKLRVVLAALLCLMLAVPAYAAAPILVRNGLTDGNWIDGTNLLRISGKEGYGMSTIEGSALTGTLYTSFYYTNGYITANQSSLDDLNNDGAFDINGKIVVPFSYGEVKVLSSDWAIGVVLQECSADNYDYSSWGSSDKFYQIQRVDVYHLPEGNKVAELARENYVDCYAVNHCINIQDRTTSVITTYDASFNALGTVSSVYGDDYAPADYETFRDNGQYGIMDAAGNVIMPASYATVYSYRYGYAEVSNGSLEGLVDLNGQLIVPVEYEAVKTTSYLAMDPENKASSTGYNAMGYFTVVKDGKVGFVNDSGEITYAPTYSKDIVECYGASMGLTDLEGNFRLIAADGVETTITGYDKVSALYYASGIYFCVTDADGNKGLIDWHGNEVLPCEYVSMKASGDGQYLLVSKDYSNYDLYQLSYDGIGAAAAPATETAVEEPAVEETAAEETVAEETTAEAPAAEESSSDTKSSLADKAAGKLNGAAATESEPAAEESTEAADTTETAAADYSAATALLNSAITLLNSDAAANKDAVVSLLNNATAALAGRDDVTILISSAITLLESDAAANGTSAAALLSNALILLQ